MIQVTRFVEVGLVGVFTLSLMSCADSAKPSPVMPSHTAASTPRAVAIEVGETHLAESSSLLEELLGEPQKAKTCTVRGNAVVDAKVTVTCPDVKAKTVTATKDTFEITNVALKACTVTFTHTNYTKTKEQKANCKLGGVVTVKFSLKKKPPVPDPDPPPPPAVTCVKCKIDKCNTEAGCLSTYSKPEDMALYQKCMFNAGTVYWACRNGPPQCTGPTPECTAGVRSSRGRLQAAREAR